MIESFGNAPLVELVAELHWTSGDTTVPEPGQPVALVMPFPGGTKLEEFFMRLGGELYQIGFQRSERLIPPGFPLLPNQGVVRYKHNDPPMSSVLFQAGVGQFSVHAIPPYHSWAEFSSFVAQGITALLKCRNEPENHRPFTELKLRYIDLFGEDLTQGRSVTRFMTEVLGIETRLPESITSLSASKEPSNVNLLLVLPLVDGTMTLNVADGKAGTRSGILLDTVFLSKTAIPADLDAIMKRFNHAHEVIHDLFIKLTMPIRELMKPQRVMNQ